MASISFPSDIPSSSSTHNDQYYSSQFDTSASFTMNPLSSHPPRTPRQSTVSSQSQVYGHSIYESKSETNKEEEGDGGDGDDESEVDEENEKAVQATKRVRREHVWREMVLTSNGRDKAFKIIQYSIRVWLYFHSTTDRLFRRNLTRPGWETELIKRLESAASGFSFTRKMMLLFNWLTPLTTVMAAQTSSFSSKSSPTKPAKTFFQAALQAPPPVLLDLVNSISDDIATLGLLGVLGKRTAEKAGQFANWCWFLSSLVGLVENGLERQMIVGSQRQVESRMYAESMGGATAKSKGTLSKVDEKELGRLQKQDYWLQVTRAKLIMDLIFVSYDLFKFKRGSKFAKVFAGLISALMSSAKLYEKHKNTLVKAATVHIS